MASDDECDACGFSSQHMAGNRRLRRNELSPLAESSPLAGSSPLAESSPLAKSQSHLYPISLELVVKRELAFMAKNAVFQGWRGLRQLRRRVEGRWMRWLSFNGHLLFALVRIWAMKPIRVDV